MEEPANGFITHTHVAWNVMHFTKKRRPVTIQGRHPHDHKIWRLMG
ncbi:MAG: hypothetical protein K6A82_09355 [Prevotella sp.]|nr:hypothetical protein [Prevotella sp.]